MAHAPAIVRAERVADQVYRTLRRAILIGQYAPGVRLREVELAASLNTSRTPIREAISRLIGDRLVVELSNGGVEVADTTAEMYEIYVIREALESSAGRLAAGRITEKELQELGSLADKTAQIPLENLEERARLNAEFHALIGEATRSPRLIEMTNSFREFFANPHWHFTDDQKADEEAHRDHWIIIEALRSGDGDRVEQSIRNHLRRAYARLIAHMTQSHGS